MMQETADEDWKFVVFIASNRLCDYIFSTRIVVICRVTMLFEADRFRNISPSIHTVIRVNSMQNPCGFDTFSYILWMQHHTK